MTMRERFCVDVLDTGADVLGEPTVLEVESEGDARASLGPPPPLVEVPPPPCDAVGKAAAEEASCEDGCGAMVLVREDSSWLAGGCCPGCNGENGDDVDEAAEDLRLPTCLEDDGGSEGKLEVAGEGPWREPLGEGVLRCSCANAVEMGVKRVLWCCLKEPHGCCWLI